MTKRLLTALAVCLIAASGCNLVYKQNVQQGNSLDQEDLDQLRLGMSMNQVAFLLGTPSVKDPFHHDRWDYVSAFARRGGEPVIRTVTLLFDEGQLVEMIGVDDFMTAEEASARMEDETEPDSEPGAETPAEPEPAEMTEQVTDVQDADDSEISDPVISEPAEEVPGEALEEAAEEATEDAAEEFVEQVEEEAVAIPEAVPTAATPAAETVIEATTEPVSEPEITTEDTWQIQLGAFAVQDNAESLVRQLVLAGFEAELVDLESEGGSGRFVVRSTSALASRDESQALLDRIESETGVEGFLFRLP